MNFKKHILRLFSFLLIVILFCTPIFAQESFNKKEIDISNLEVYPGGMPFGVKIISKGLTVVKFSDTSGKNVSSAYEAGIREGDVIIKINGNTIKSIEDFVYHVNKNGGNKITVTVLRSGQEMNFDVCPKFSPDDGKYKTGIWVKDSTSGIGTVTYIIPETNAFAGLGHPICDSITGKIVPLTKGTVMDVNINGVIKGQIGTAGELKGSFENRKIGTLIMNTQCGVYGLFSSDAVNPPQGKIKVCPKEEIKEGEAYIWSTVKEGPPQKYKVYISNIDTSNSNVKNFRVKVIDEELLRLSGGIVQGMSGSPIIQNGKLVGAVTHVLINDPTTGYGIFIENMLSQMGKLI